MKNSIHKHRKRISEEGFTLIELIIVVVIVGILSAVAVPIYMDQQREAIRAGMKADVRNAQIEIFTALAKAPTAAVIISCVYGGGEPGRTLILKSDGSEIYAPLNASDKQTKIEAWGTERGQFIVRAFNVDAQYVVEFDSAANSTAALTELVGSGDYGPCDPDAIHTP